MQTAEQIGDEIIETAESIHFIPTNGGVEWSLPDIMDMKVGTKLKGHIRIRKMGKAEYLHGTMIVRRAGLQFEPA